MGKPMDRTDRVFDNPSTFEKAFPTLQDAIVECTEFKFLNRQVGSRRFDLRSQGGLMRCSNPRCYRGGYELDHEVSRLLSNQVKDSQVTEISIQMSCPGDEGTPKRIVGRTCGYSIEGKVRLSYKSDAHS